MSGNGKRKRESKSERKPKRVKSVPGGPRRSRTSIVPRTSRPAPTLTMVPSLHGPSSMRPRAPTAPRSLASFGPSALLNARSTGVHTLRTYRSGESTVTMTEGAPVAETSLVVDRKLELHSGPGGQTLTVKFNQPFCDIASFGQGTNAATSATFSYGSCMTLPTADSTVPITHPVGLALLNPIKIHGMLWNITDGSAYRGDFVMKSPGLPLQAMGYSKYRFKSQYFTYSAQGQSFQDTAATLGESRLRFCFTQDPCHPVIGEAGFLNFVHGYGVLAETPNSVQFSEWNSWQIHVPGTTDWLYLYAPRAVVQTAANPPQLDHRFAFAGAVSCYDAYGGESETGQSGRVDMPHGTLWWGGEVEFADPSPLLYNRITPFFMSKLLTLDEQDDKREEKKTELVPVAPLLRVDPDDDFDGADPSPPRFRPAPSAASASSVTGATSVASASSSSQKKMK